MEEAPAVMLEAICLNHPRLYLLKALLSMEDHHKEFAFLHSCFAFTKFVFSLRITDTSVHNKVRQLGP